MTTPDVNLHDTIDVPTWVRAWMRTIHDHPEIPQTEGAMSVWFAHAMMAGYDAARRYALQDAWECHDPHTHIMTRLVYVTRDLAQVIGAVNDEVRRARLAFPGRDHMLAALMEEVGELAQALIEHDRGSVPASAVEREAIQVACMALRVATEGDAAFTYQPPPREEPTL